MLVDATRNRWRGGRTQRRTRQIDIGQLENGCLDVTLIQGCRLAEIFCSKPILEVSLVVVAAGCPRDIFILWDEEILLREMVLTLRSEDNFAAMVSICS